MTLPVASPLHDRETLLPGARLGVLGGGQLGRMFALAARRMGYRVGVLTPEEDSPAAQAADCVVHAPFDDQQAVAYFARQVSAITFEFENVPAETVVTAAALTRVRPGGKLLAVAQDRLLEKETLARLGLPIARYAPVRSQSDVAAAAASVRGAGVLKTSRLGYDGKGQCRVARPEELGAAWDRLGRAPCVLEEWVPFRSELSVVGARGADGEVALYEPFENDHANHVLDSSVCPAPIDDRVRSEAERIARAVLEGLDVVGVSCIEMFHLADGRVLVNEIAPRPHNSGHLTLDAHECSQFEQQVRALAGLPLGSTSRAVPAGAMVNLLGDLWRDGEPAWARAAALPGVRLHLYGKAEPRPGRKMGHLTVTAERAGEALARARAAREALTGGPPAS